MIWASGKELYGMFLESDFWRELSKRKRRECPRCARCGGHKRLQAHHRFYRENWFDTLEGDLEVLCRGCHEKEHGIVAVPAAGLDDSRIPEHAFTEKKETETSGIRFSTFKEVQKARSRHAISRAEFKAWRKKFKEQRLRRKEKKRLKLEPRVLKRRVVKEYGYKVIEHHYGEHREFRSKWVNRGSTSN